MFQFGRTGRVGIAVKKQLEIIAATEANREDDTSKTEIVQVRNDQVCVAT